MNRPLRLVGCGILRQEVAHLIASHGWPIDTDLLDSALHNYLNRLADQLEGALDRCAHAGRDAVVFYGSCHPRMDSILERHHALRTRGQNCIAMLLGHERFMAELTAGAYFLLEDWALTWEPMITAAFGSNRAVVRDIFRGSHRHILALRTPCSGDFRAAAEAAAAYVDLPLLWADVDLDHLDAALTDALAQAQRPQAKP